MADLYPTVPSIRRIVHDAELEQWRIDFNAAVIDIWHAVLTEAEKVGKLPELLAIIHTEYGTNERFRQIYRSYMQPKSPSVSTHPDKIAQQSHEPGKPPTQVQRRSGLFLGAFALVVVLIALSTQRGLIGKLLPLVENPSPTAGEAGSTPVETQVVPLAARRQSPTPMLPPTAQFTPTLQSIATLPIVSTETATPQPTATPFPVPTATFTVTPQPSLTTVTGTTVSTNGEQADTGKDAEIAEVVTINTARLRIRSSPSTSNEIVTIAEAGQQFQLLGRSDDGQWVQLG